MTAKEYLRQLKYLDNRINAKLLEKRKLKAIAIDLSEDIVTRLNKLEKDINKDIDKLVYLKEEAAGKIDRISDDRYKVILSMYYLSNETFEETAERIGKSFQWVHTLHKKALKEFEKILNS